MTLDMNSRIIIVSGVIQGLGIGFTFVPLSAVAFATLAPDLRNDGTPIFSLLRNIGSSVGISIVQAMLTSGTARAHAELATDISAGNLALPVAAADARARPRPAGLGVLNAEVNRQAAMMAYLDDFRFMLALTRAVAAAAAADPQGEAGARSKPGGRARDGDGARGLTRRSHVRTGFRRPRCHRSATGVVPEAARAGAGRTIARMTRAWRRPEEPP